MDELNMTAVEFECRLEIRHAARWYHIGELAQRLGVPLVDLPVVEIDPRDVRGFVRPWGD
jgi:hypothetical protein